MTPYEGLANAIIEQAAKDYHKALRYHFAHPERVSYKREVESIGRFFRSGWYQELTNVSGEYIIRRLRAIVSEEMSA